METTASLYAIYLCDLCVHGKGGECHSPGCALWINRAPDLALTTPLLQPMEEYLAERAAQRSGGEGRRAAVPQPAPTGEGTPVLPAVLAHPLVTPRMRADLQARAIDGAEKYGTVLRTHNGRVAIVDAYQEALDGVMYLAQGVLEVGDPRVRSLLDCAVEIALGILRVMERRGL